jgi:hypothetical protein
MTPVAEKKEKKAPLVVSEIRLSMLEKVLEGPDKGAHTKHIAAVITDPDLCAAIQALIEPALVCPCRNEKTGEFDPDCELCDGDGEATLDTLPDAYKAEIKARPKSTRAELKAERADLGGMTKAALVNEAAKKDGLDLDPTSTKADLISSITDARHDTAGK